MREQIQSDWMRLWTYDLALMISLGSVLMGCTRDVPAARLVIQVPALSKNFEALTTTQSSGQNPWSGEITSFSQVNCYVVAVGGPEPELRGNYCKEKTTDAELFRFGPFEGGIPAGSQISIDVPSGSARKVILLALQAQPGACRSFKNQGPASGQVSYPRVVGIKSVDLSPGTANVSFAIPTNLTALSQIDDCSVANGSSPGGGGPGVWGDGRDGMINGISTGTTIAMGTSTYGGVANLNYVPAPLGQPSTKVFGFQSRVIAVDIATGRSLTLATSPSTSELAIDDKIIWHISGGWASPSPDANACGGGLSRGSWGLSRVTSVAGPTVILESPVSQTPGTLNPGNFSVSPVEGTAHCYMQLTRVSQFSALTVPAGNTFTITLPLFSSATGTGGLFALWVKNLDVNGTLNINQQGAGHQSSASGAFGIGGAGSSTAGSENRPGTGGGNGGGGGLGGAGGNGSTGMGGGTLPYCSGTCFPFTAKKAFFGASGAGTGSLAGGNGGGVILLFFENIMGTGSVNINASGATSGSTNAGGGAGGSVLLMSKSILGGSGPLVGVNVSGGNGVGLGGGGAGGILERAFCPGSVGLNVNVSKAGGTGTTSGGVGVELANGLSATAPENCF